MPANGHGLARTRGVRYRADTGFEIWCPDCDTFWPATEEFWPVKVGMQRCSACNASKKRIAEKARKKLLSAQIAAANAIYYRENHQLLRFKDNRRKTERRLTTTMPKIVAALTFLALTSQQLIDIIPDSLVA